MNPSEVLLDKAHGERAMRWFDDYFSASIVGPFASHFPGWPLPKEIQNTQRGIEHIANVTSGNIGAIPLVDWLQRLTPQWAPLFKRVVLLYRRHHAAETERRVEKTIHLEFTETLEEERKMLDVLTGTPEFLQIADVRLPRLNEYFPVKLVEAAASNQVPFAARQFDDKFGILQASSLFLSDVAYFRAKCDERETPLAIAFADIDEFKKLNTKYTETKIDRNLLPRFMQAVEAHVFHHGYAYRQGGDEYLILVPSLSKPLAIAFLDELRRKVADLSYPEIAEKTTVSIGLCIADPDCAWTDRELLERANRAKEFAKRNGKNCLATYSGHRLTEDELAIVAPS